MVAPGKASQIKQPAIIFSVSLGTKACHQLPCAGYTVKFNKYFVMREINLCFLKENPLFSVLLSKRRFRFHRSRICLPGVRGQCAC